MIISEKFNFRIDKPLDVDLLTGKQRKELTEEEQAKALLFKPHYKCETNRDKLVYKVGFLREFLRRLYPEEPTAGILKILNDRYEVFIGRRQVERHAREYILNEKYH